MSVEADEVVTSALCDRSKVSPWGVHGGGAGQRLAFLVKRSGEPDFVTFTEAFGVTSPTKFSNVRLRRGDAVMLRSPSGGGYGPPWERPIERVLADVESGFISVERAKLDYGVAVREDGTVDEAATDGLRTEMADGVG
jgi:N-methylhydantoinase B/oxoprolinase/acetone carboxylase alpha subunit